MVDTISPDALRAVRKELNAILRKTSAVNREVATIFDLLDGAVPLPANAAAGNGDGPNAAATKAGTTEEGPPGAPKWYEVRDVDGEPRLLEYREEGGAPFAVPRRVHDAMAVAVAAHSGKKFEQIYRKAAAELGEEARDYQGRVLFRFWQWRRLLTRDRGRYVIACPREQFAARAEAAWDALAHGKANA